MSPEPFSVSGQRELQSAACLGSCGLPATGSEQWESGGLQTGACPVCTGRFHLDQTGQIPWHAIVAALHSSPVVTGAAA